MSARFAPVSLGSSYAASRGAARSLGRSLLVALGLALGACSVGSTGGSAAPDGTLHDEVDAKGAGGDEEPGESVVGPAAAAGTDYRLLCGGAEPDCHAGTDECAAGGDPSGGAAGQGASVLGCRLTMSRETARVSASCGEVGQGAAGAPCRSVADCGDGLGCVATVRGTFCRAYCCFDRESCAKGSYCALARMAEAVAEIPACVEAVSCTPLDDTTCESGRTCTVVRDDGTTTCVSPGDGARGEACPCAAGHACSRVTNLCVKLCRLGRDREDCGEGACQGGTAAYPDGIGSCVGY